MSTPALTPDDGSDYSGSSDSFIENVKENDALDFLMTLFPHHGLSALPYSRSVTISAPNMGVEFHGVVLTVPGKPKTLYVDGKSAQSVNLRERLESFCHRCFLSTNFECSIEALLDLADEALGCNSLIIILERSSPNLGSVLHSLMYVGGIVVTKPVYKIDPAYVLVGLEI